MFGKIKQYIPEMYFLRMFLTKVFIWQQARVRDYLKILLYFKENILPKDVMLNISQQVKIY